MATLQQKLTTARDQLADRLVEATASPKPNYSVDGESYSWESYQAMLVQQIANLDEAIQRAGGPFENVSYGY